MKTLSFDNVFSYSEDEINELTKDSSSKDYYFSLISENQFNFVRIVPISYYNKYKSYLDYELNISHLLPIDFHKELELLYSSNRDLKELDDDLSYRGFVNINTAK